MSVDDDITKRDQPADASAGNGLALFTDLYQLTMLQAYFEERMTLNGLSSASSSAVCRAAATSSSPADSTSSSTTSNHSTSPCKT